MLKQSIKDKIDELFKEYQELSKTNKKALYEIAISEIPEMVYNSNAIENSTLTLEDTESILLYNQVKKDHDIREVHETINLAKITKVLLENPNQKLTIEFILDLHKILLTNINDKWAGRFRRNDEWVRIGTHIGANPKFVDNIMQELVKEWNSKKDKHFLEKIAYFHAEFEIIHPFCDGNGRMGRVLINQQLMNLGYPPIIIQNKSKKKDYYPLFDEYRFKSKFDGFSLMFSLLLLESLHKRITILTAKKIISVNEWAKKNNIKTNIALNKAKRQTIPAFRLREKWSISADFNKN